MRLRSGIFALAVITAAPAQAQQVELLHFGDASPSIVLNVGPEPVIAPTEVQAGALDDILIADFEHLAAQGAAPAGEPLIPASRIAVPVWMQTGIAGNTSTHPFLSSPGETPCASTAYLPRRDIGLSAENRRAQLFPLISSIACEHGLPVGLFDALIAQESRYLHNAVSGAGAMGLAQLMPGTARYLGVLNPWDPVQNLRGGAKYLREQLNEFGRVDLALAAYNAGPGRVRTARRVPRIRETINYVAVITAAWSAQSQSGGAAGMTTANGGLRNPFRRAAVVTYTSSNTPNPM